jgi:uncharacterized protein (DUF849 family)
VAPKTVITCAITGSAQVSQKHPQVPLTPVQIAASAIEAARAGAAVVHIHVRDPQTGHTSGDSALFRQVVDRIRASDVDVILNLTTSYGARFYPDPPPGLPPRVNQVLAPERRVAHVVELRPEICTLDMGSMNLRSFVFVNTPGHLERMAVSIKEAGVKPELEVFDSGMIRLARDFIQRGLIDSPPLFQLCLGTKWGIEASPRAMGFMRDQLPEGAVWSALGVGRHEFPVLAQAVLMGGHVRVGLEDNLYLEKGVPAPSNAALVEKAVLTIEALGGQVATAQEARRIFQTRGAELDAAQE